MAYNDTCKRFTKRKMGSPGKFFQGIQMDKTRGLWKSDKKSKTWQASFLKIGEGVEF